uniref:Uncharacterized protein n=1 Tax=Bryopsis sp. HV04063 TaxID=1979421 RepID=A0A2P0QIU3_9CHLO|nr:hypothetical protein [Bryopsis sp. HV04063]ARO74108.1 hypothetical protein [Bryopsis sp. HV04063]
MYNPLVQPIKYWKTSNWDDKIVQIGIKYKNIYFEHSIYQNYDTPKTTLGLRLDIPVDWKDFFTYSAKTKSLNLFKEKNILPVYSKNESFEYQFSILKNYSLNYSTLEHNPLLNSNFEYNFYYESYREASPEEDIPEYVCGHSKQHLDIVPEKQTQSIVSEIEESPQMLTPNVWSPQGIYFFLLGVCIYPIFGKLKKWWISRF